MKPPTAQGFPRFSASQPGTPFPAFSRQVCQNFARKFDRPDLHVPEFIDRDTARGWIRRALRFSLPITNSLSSRRARLGEALRPDGGSDGR
jgi:hypothetical protein